MCPDLEDHSLKTHIGIGDLKKLRSFKDKLSPLLAGISENILIICSVPL